MKALFCLLLTVSAFANETCDSLWPANPHTQVAALRDILGLKPLTLRQFILRLEDPKKQKDFLDHFLGNAMPSGLSQMKVCLRYWRNLDQSARKSIIVRFLDSWSESLKELETKTTPPVTLVGRARQSYNRSEFDDLSAVPVRPEDAQWLMETKSEILKLLAADTVREGLQADLMESFPAVVQRPIAFFSLYEAHQAAQALYAQKYVGIGNSPKYESWWHYLTERDHYGKLNVDRVTWTSLMGIVGGLVGGGGSLASLALGHPVGALEFAAFGTGIPLALAYAPYWRLGYKKKKLERQFRQFPGRIESLFREPGPQLPFLQRYFPAPQKPEEPAVLAPAPILVPDMEVHLDLPRLQSLQLADLSTLPLLRQVSQDLGSSAAWASQQISLFQYQLHPQPLSEALLELLVERQGKPLQATVSSVQLELARLKRLMPLLLGRLETASGQMEALLEVAAQRQAWLSPELQKVELLGLKAQQSAIAREVLAQADYLTRFSASLTRFLETLEQKNQTLVSYANVVSETQLQLLAAQALPQQEREREQSQILDQLRSLLQELSLT